MSVTSISVTSRWRLNIGWGIDKVISAQIDVSDISAQIEMLLKCNDSMILLHVCVLLVSHLPGIAGHQSRSAAVCSRTAAAPHAPASHQRADPAAG